MLHQNKAKYLEYSLKLKQREVEKIAEFDKWLPVDVIDCHAHSNLPSHVYDMEEKTYQHMISTFPNYTIEESQLVNKLFYPSKRIKTLRFAKTFKGIDHKSANGYLLKNSPLQDRIALFGLPEDVEYTTSMIYHDRVSALKMYYSYVDPTATTIYEFFKPKILEVAQDADIPIVLHLPQRITKSANDLHRMIRDFPNLRITLAHLGLPKFLIPGLEDVYKEFKRYPQIMMDTALCPSVDVVEASIRNFGKERIMFGSDEPYHLIRSCAYENPLKGERIVTEYPFHWVDQNEFDEYGHLAHDAIHCNWTSLDSIKGAINRFPLSQREGLKNAIFHTNAAAFYGF